MKSTEQLFSESKKSWSQLKSEVEHLGVQLALGRNEAKEAFERESKKVFTFLEEQNQRLRRHSPWAERLFQQMVEHTRQLKETLQEPVTGDEKRYASWRESLLRSIYELEFIIDELYPMLKTDEKELVSTFRIRMEVYRASLLPLHFDEIATLNLQTLQLSEKANEVLAWREQDIASSREKFQRFTQQIGTSFDHMKQAFGELLK